MPKNLTESTTWASTITVPVTGDARTAGSLEAAFQAIADRTKNLRNWLMQLDPDYDGDLPFPQSKTVYVNDGVEERLGDLAEFEDSSLLSVTLSTVAMPTTYTNYLVNVDANLVTATGYPGSVRIAKTTDGGANNNPLPGTTLPCPGYIKEGGQSVPISIHSSFQANSGLVPLVIKIQAKATSTGDYIPLKANSSLVVTVQPGTATVTGNGTP